MKMILTYFFIASSFCYGQKVSLNSDQRFYLETGCNSSFVNYTELRGDGYVWSNSQMRLGLPINLAYRNSIFQLGISATVVSFGSRPENSSIARFFLPNNMNLHFGYNFMSLTKNTKSYIGPFIEIGVLNMGWTLGKFRFSNGFGLEAYISNSTKVSIGAGSFHINAEDSPKVRQILDNSYLTFEISHSFPIRLPEPRIIIEQ